MVEVIVGIALIVAGLGLGAGIAARVVSLGGLEFIAGLMLAVLGAVIVAHGVFRRMRDRPDGNAYQIRRHGLMFAVLLCALALICVGIGIFGRLTVSGVAVGYHITAEGIPLAILVLFIAFNRKHHAIERDERSASQVASRARQEDAHGY